ncbi:Hsp70 family protein [Actinomadura formosensis]|uniref:Hsp70 family protein n=1 Tax=Actinomadura formosensis TaxID=60706 RepID=UPI003D92B769
MTGAPSNDGIIIGFDLGHGETSLARLSSRDPEESPSLGEPEVLDLAQCGDHFTSAVAVYTSDSKTGETPEILIGNNVYVSGWIPREEYIGFKSPDLTDPAMRRGTELFVGEVVRRLTAPGTQVKTIPDGSVVRWIFGVPSGWTPEVREEYRELLAGICQGDVQVIPESRAAMLYAQHSRDVPSGPRSGKALVIDLGSSTADYTLVSGLAADSFAWDGGTPLGASLLDKAIMQHALATYEAGPHAEPDLLVKILQSGTTRNRLELHCRRAKEDFFRSLPAASQMHLFAPIYRPIRLKHPGSGEEININIELTPEFMTEIYQRPLPELKGRSWDEAFRGDLASICAALGEEVPATIVMTGGASRMFYAQQAVTDTFPESQVILGAEPQFAIAKGLAIVGGRQEQVTRFRAEVERYVDGDEIPQLLDDRMKALARDLGKIMSRGLVEDHMIPATLKWRNGDLDTVAEIEGEVQRTYQAFLASPKADRMIRSAVERWTAEITGAIDRKTRPICEAAGVPADTLSISHSPEYKRHAEVEGSVGQKMALDLYNQIGNWMVGAFSAIAALVTLAASTIAFEAASLALATAAASGTVATIWNPWLVTGLVALAAGGLVWGAFAGKERLLGEIRTRKLPPRVRRMVKEDTLRDKVRAEARKESLEEGVAEKIAAKFLELNENKLKVAFLDGVRKHLHAVADRTELLIRPSGRTIILDAAPNGLREDDPDGN